MLVGAVGRCREAGDGTGWGWEGDSLRQEPRRVAHVSTASLAIVSVAVACPPLFHTHMHSTLPPTHSHGSCCLPPGTLFASERHTLAYAPGDKGWIISDNDWPGQLFSFLLEADGQHWRGVKVRGLLGGGGGCMQTDI